MHMSGDGVCVCVCVRGHKTSYQVHLERGPPGTSRVRPRGAERVQCRAHVPHQGQGCGCNDLPRRHMALGVAGHDEAVGTRGAAHGVPEHEAAAGATRNHCQRMRIHQHPQQPARLTTATRQC